MSKIELIDATEVADIAKMKLGYFQKISSRGQGPQIFTKKNKKYLYDKAVVEQWVKDHPWKTYERGQNPNRREKGTNLVNVHIKLERNQLALFRQKFPDEELGPFIRSLLWKRLT